MEFFQHKNCAMVEKRLRNVERGSLTYMLEWWREYSYSSVPTCWGKLALGIHCTTALHSLVQRAEPYQVSKWKSLEGKSRSAITSTFREQVGGKQTLWAESLPGRFLKQSIILLLPVRLVSFVTARRERPLYVPLAHENMPQQEGLSLVSTGKGDQPWDFTQQQQCVTKNRRIQSGKYCCNLWFASVHLVFFTLSGKQGR